MPDRKKEPDAKLRRLGDAVAALRAASGLTQEALADAAGLTPRYLQMLERGDANPSYLKLSALSDALGVDLAQLIRRAASRLTKRDG